MNKKGFTLIELLAVIIILGILMIIAIPSVTKYISDSRKNAYIDSAKEIIGSARNLVNSGELEMYDTDATYYLDVKCINTENAMKSPYGEFVDLGAYVVVTYNGKGYDYYWTSVDDAGQGIKDIVKYDKLDIDNIESDLTVEDISTLRTLDGRGKVILITDRNGCKKEGAITENLVSVSGEAGGNSSNNAVVYPSGKTKDTVVTGDIVKIGTEEFYVVKHDGNDLVLLAHYNLNVGSNKKSDETEGIQSKNVVGYKSGKTTYGNIAYSSSNYWSGKIGTDYSGRNCSGNTYTEGTNCAYVYDSNSDLYQYVEAYKSYLEGLGAIIKSARLFRVEEAFELGCGNGVWNCANAPAFLKETSFWFGSSYNSNDVWDLSAGEGISFFNHDTYYFEDNFGVRPVIII